MEIYPSNICLMMMRQFFVALIVILLSVGCKRVSVREVSLSQIPLQNAVFNRIQIDSTKLLNPRGIFLFQKYIIIMEGNNTPAFTFWDSDNLNYEFSDGYTGSGPNEFIRPRSDYFAYSDSSFYILDSNIEWEIKLDQNKIRVINKEPIIIPDAINQLIHLPNGKYIMAGNTHGSNNAEHIIYDKDTGNYTCFGTYPSSDLPDERKFIFDFKYTAGLYEKPCVWDFYENHNLIRQYDLDGHLLQEVRLCDIPERHNTESDLRAMHNRPYWKSVYATKNHIFTLFYKGETSEQIYSNDALPELQVWDWDGNMKRRIVFDQKIDRMAISDSGILFAINTKSFDNSVYYYECKPSVNPVLSSWNYVRTFARY